MEFLNQLGVIRGTIKKIIKKEAQGMAKAAEYIEFETAKGIISKRSSIPYSEYDKKTIQKMCDMVGVQVSKWRTDLIGKEFSILAAPFEFNGKVMWNVRDVYSAKYPLIGEDTAPAGVDDGFGQIDTSDDLGF